MAEYSSKSRDDEASRFIVATCQLLPKSNSVTSDHAHDLIRAPKGVTKQYLIACGSSEEFYIQPLNSCIDDIDYLVCQTNRLAFIGWPNCTQLPSNISGLADAIECYSMEPSIKYPGFVQLRAMGEMNYNWKCKTYEFSQTIPPGIYLKINRAAASTLYISHHPGILDTKMTNTVSGPAITTQSEFDLLANDVVNALFCPEWPSEAQNWPLRPRKFEWPTIDTIAEVVRNGCHVVYVQHRACRNVDQMWRLSFSVAELILLQSWTKTQQIVYHLLRFFAKKELIQKDCPKDDEVLCPYHLKTLMLWTCEEMSPDWWNSASVITICCELLKKLSEWLQTGWCRNYFIPEANLFYESSNSTVTVRREIERRLNEFKNPDILSHWFEENYILPITTTQYEFLKIRKEVPDFMDCLQPLLEHWKTHESLTLNSIFSVRFMEAHQKCRISFECGLQSGLRFFLRFRRCFSPMAYSSVPFLPTTEKILCFKYYDFLLYILHFAYGLRYGEISWESSIVVELVEVISAQTKIVRSEHHNFPKTYTEHSSRFQFIRAQNLMKNITGSNSRSEFQLLSLMSKEFLRESLKYDDTKSNGVAPAAFAYLAALCFATSEYEQAMRFCFAVLKDSVSTLDNKETLNAGCLLFIEDVARIVGFSILHKQITNNNLQYTNGRLYLDLRLSPEVFAHYIAIVSAERIATHIDFNPDLPYTAFAMDDSLKDLSAERLSLHNHLESYRALPESVFPMDDYLKALLKSKCIALMKTCTQFNSTSQVVYSRTYSLTDTETAEANPLVVREMVIDSLMEIALENMTSFYSVMDKDFGIQCNTTDCYRAMYLYKCRQYDDVLHLCEQILHEPDLQNHLKKFAFANVLLLPPLDSFFDGDVQSLLGFHTLVYYLSPLNNDVGQNEIGLNEESSSLLWFARDVRCQRRGLSECLRTCEPMSAVRCPYFLGRHFLARYLKVKCFHECNLPYSEALIEFSAHKTDHQFEHIIREFILRKL